MGGAQSESDDAKSRTDGVRVSAAKCVHCGKPVTPRSRPFCSQRCADLDLGAWFRGSYRVAGAEAANLDSDSETPVDKSETAP